MKRFIIIVLISFILLLCSYVRTSNSLNDNNIKLKDAKYIISFSGANKSKYINCIFILY